MIWKGKTLTTLGDLFDGVMACDTKEEAAEFMAQYRAENEHANANIGYLSGYCGPDEMRRVQEWFGAAHPIFGSAVPTPVEAVAAGRSYADNNGEGAK